MSLLILPKLVPAFIPLGTRSVGWTDPAREGPGTQPVAPAGAWARGVMWTAVQESSPSLREAWGDALPRPHPHAFPTLLSGLLHVPREKSPLPSPKGYSLTYRKFCLGKAGRPDGGQPCPGAPYTRDAF